VHAWRIVKEKHLSSAFDGEGAMRSGGRWNRPGTKVVYVSGTRALAVLEILVHVESRDALATYALIEVEFDERLVEELDVERLPRNWRDYPAPLTDQALGSAWAAEKRTAVLAVPSAILPRERNYLLNPEHPDFEKITRSQDPETLELDPRLLGTRKDLR
jgi:RES domain-containing protein